MGIEIMNIAFVFRYSSLVFSVDQKSPVNSKPRRYIVNVCPIMFWKWWFPGVTFLLAKFAVVLVLIHNFKMYKIQPHQLLKLYWRLI